MSETHFVVQKGYDGFGDINWQTLSECVDLDCAENAFLDAKDSIAGLKNWQVRLIQREDKVIMSIS